MMWPKLHCKVIFKYRATVTTAPSVAYPATFFLFAGIKAYISSLVSKCRYK